MNKWISFSKRLPEDGQKILEVENDWEVSLPVIYLRTFKLKGFLNHPEFFRPKYWQPFEVEDDAN